MTFVVEGIVIEGDHRGRELGYPTANIDHRVHRDLPDDGVYAGTVERADGTVYLSAISVGTRETFYHGDGLRLVEAYLLDFDGDLYGERLRVTLLEALRTQRRFDGIDELIAQIHADVEETRARLGDKELTRSR